MMDIVRLAHYLSPYVVGAEGNVSCRLPNGFLIKGSGHGFKNLTIEQIAECDKDGNQIGRVRPSMEAAFHALLYRINPKINYIAHTHPVNCLKILMSYHDTQRFATQRFFPDQVVFNGVRSCVVPYAKPGEPLAEQIAAALHDFDEFPDVFLLRNHGIICCGRNHNDVIIKTEICEKAASCINFNSEPLSTTDILELVGDEKEKFRKDLI